MTVNEKFFQWLDKLESGDIQQGEGSLHKVRPNDDGTETDYMCCLGVCSSMFAEELGFLVQRDGYSFFYGGKAHYPNKDVLLHMGIPESHIVERSIGWSVLVSTPDNVRDRVDEDYYDTGTIGVDVLNDNNYTHVEIAALLRKEFVNA